MGVFLLSILYRKINLVYQENIRKNGVLQKREGGLRYKSFVMWDEILLFYNGTISLIFINITIKYKKL